MTIGTVALSRHRPPRYYRYVALDGLDDEAVDFALRSVGRQVERPGRVDRMPG